MTNKIISTNEEITFTDSIILDLIKTGKAVESRVVLKRNDKTADCRSVLEVLLLGTEKGTHVEVIAEGSDEHLAIERIAGIFHKELQFN